MEYTCDLPTRCRGIARSQNPATAFIRFIHEMSNQEHFHSYCDGLLWKCLRDEV